MSKIYDEVKILMVQLKLPCVALSKITIGGRSRSSSELLHALEAVQHELEEARFLDPELANYVFFPLARIFSAIASTPANALEVSLKCLRILISRGWAKSNDASLCKQLLILLSFITDPSAIPGKEQAQNSDIVTLAALGCLLALFGDSSSLVLSLCRNKEERPIPVLGQTISALLTTLRNNLGPEVDLRASNTIKSFVSCIQDEALLLNFLPGIVSALTRYAAPRGNARKPAKSLVNVLDSLATILRRAFSLAAQHGDASESLDDGSPGTQKWRDVQSPQVTKALSQLIQLRYHTSEDVRTALFSLCASLLRDCQPALQESAQPLLSTSVYISGSSGASAPGNASSLYTIVASDANLARQLDELMQEWLIALPRLALEGDRDKLQKQCEMLVAGYYCASRYTSYSTQLISMVLQSFQDSVAIALRPTSSSSDLLVKEDRPTSKAMTVTMLQEARPDFKPLGHTIKGGAEILKIFQSAVSTLTDDEAFRDYAYQALTESASTKNEDLLSSLWLARQVFWRTTPDDNDVSQFLTGFEADNEARLDEIDAVYSQAVGLLTDFDETIRADWRLQAISLEIVASMAHQQGTAFQSELVDVLFPVIERIGSQDVEVRERALTCLNILATACGAKTAGELVIQNADYLVNSMALKLNAFEISAQAPRVMVMVIHLCGPSLLPYLDDILESIFSALSSFHGYPRLVDALFSVLEAMVDQGSNPSSKLLEAPSPQHKASKNNSLSILQIVDELKSLKGLSSSSTVSDGEESIQAIPASETDTDDQVQPGNTQEEKVEPSKTYQMVQSIARHSQYYLTHASAALRQRLLKLMSTASTSLSRNEDQYLPLLNDVWPVIVTRLYDSEAAVSMEAMESMSMLFESAGDFLLSRVQTEWPRILGLGKRIRTKADAENRGKSGRGSFSMTYQMLERYIAMLLDLVIYIGVSGEAEDDIFGLFSSMCDRASVGRLLHEVNADSYWLLTARANKHGSLMHSGKPLVSGFDFHDLFF